MDAALFSGDKDLGGVFAPDTLRPPLRSRCRMMLRLPRLISRKTELSRKAAPNSNEILVAMIDDREMIGKIKIYPDQRLIWRSSFFSMQAVSVEMDDDER